MMSGELASISMMYLTPVSFGSMSFNVRPLWIGLINALFNCTGSRYKLTFPLALGTKMKLLHYCDISSSPNSFCNV